MFRIFDLRILQSNRKATKRSSHTLFRNYFDNRASAVEQPLLLAAEAVHEITMGAVVLELESLPVKKGLKRSEAFRFKRSRAGHCC